MLFWRMAKKGLSKEVKSEQKPESKPMWVCGGRAFQAEVQHTQRPVGCVLGKLEEQCDQGR